MKRATKEQVNAFHAVVAQFIERRGGDETLSITERKHLNTALLTAYDIGEPGYYARNAVEIYLSAGAGITADEAKTIIALIFG